MNPIIEKVARAIDAVMHREDDTDPTATETYARAAIKATLEHFAENVSEGMGHAGGCSLEHPTVRMEGPSIHSMRNAKRAMEAMLIQALSELDA